MSGSPICLYSFISAAFLMSQLIDCTAQLALGFLTKVMTESSGVQVQINENGLSIRLNDLNCEFIVTNESDGIRIDHMSGNECTATETINGYSFNPPMLTTHLCVHAVINYHSAQYAII